MPARILPPTTALPSKPLSRKHEPPRQPYSGYRDCLRWEFGFSCAFCWLHEADLTPRGAQGSAQWWIEHRELQSDRSDLQAAYLNCYYSCRWCNQARSASPSRGSRGERLLDPCQEAWGKHFQLEGPQLLPRAGDKDASYTDQLYDLNDPRKCQLREQRRADILEAQRVLQEIPGLIDRLLARTRSCASAQPLIEAAQELRKHLLAAQKQIERYRAIPADAPRLCACGPAQEHHLPPFLADQTLSLEAP